MKLAAHSYPYAVQAAEKIEQPLHLSFDRPEDVLKIELACHLRETFASQMETEK